MRIRSHLDPTMFIIFQHINAKHYDLEFQKLVRNTNWEPGTQLGPVMAALKKHERRTLAHERYHFWQGLRLPFLNLYATETFRTSFVVLRKLVRTGVDWRNWASLGWSVPVFDRLDRIFVLSGDSCGHLAFGAEQHPDYEFFITFSAKEMLECAASIFDFQISCCLTSDISNPDKFDLWCKRNPAYVRLYEFYSRFLGSTCLALRTILPLINHAFYTSFPERAFVELMGKMWSAFVRPKDSFAAFLAHSEPCRWSELLQFWLQELSYDHNFGSYPEKFDFDKYDFYYLDPKEWIASAIGGGIQHPFLGPPAVAWQNQAKVLPGLEFYIDLPGYVLNNEVHDFVLTAQPQLRIVRVFLEAGEDRVFALGEGLIAPAFKHKYFRQQSISEYRGMVLDMLAAYGAFRRATGAQMTDVARTCYHEACPCFPNNYCNSYPLIPRQFNDCGFPSRMDHWVKVVR